MADDSDESVGSHGGVSAQGREILRRFKFIYVMLRSFIYILIWSSLAGGFAVLMGRISLFIALLCIIVGFAFMRLASAIVFEPPLEKRSLFILRLTFFFAFCFGFYQAGLSESLAPPLGSWSLGTGLILWCVGMFGWWRARSSLGLYYYDVVYLQSEQSVCSEGVYAHLRHPGYCAEWISWVGGAFMLNRFWPAVILPCVLLLAMGYRIWVEEKTLSEKLKGYVTYCQSVKRLKLI